jgi:Spy/CpxP family protein refolding chaperone
MRKFATEDSLTRRATMGKSLTRRNVLATAAAAMVTLVAGSTLALAQPAPRRGFGGRGPEGPGGSFVGLQVELLRGLDLSEVQRDQVRTIMTTHREESRALQQRQQAAMRALQDATEGTDEAAIRQQGEAVGAVIADAAVLRSKVRAEVWAVLTPEQQAKAEQLRAERKTRMAERQKQMQQRMEQRRQRGAQPRG